MNDSDIKFSQISGNKGDIALITLDRPQVINAMTTEMCRKMHDQLGEWAREKNIKAVVIRGNGERGFCAGGDLRHFYEMGHAGIEASKEFFWHEYRLNYCIFNFPKPYIAFLHGITMGGGVGVSVHGSHRVAAEDLIFAMPETGIGFYPDIGSSYFLPRLLDKTGFYLGLTGTRISVADAHYAGLVDSVVSKNRFDDLINLLAITEFTSDARASVMQIINQLSISPEPPKLIEHRVAIDRCFSKMTMEEIIHTLQQEKTAWALNTIETLLTKSPTSLKVTLSQLQRGETITDFAENMRMEFRMTNRFLYNRDFYEGIRAALIDKDRNPKWQPATLTEVNDAEIAKYFAPLPKELSFD